MSRPYSSGRGAPVLLCTLLAVLSLTATQAEDANAVQRAEELLKEGKLDDARPLAESHLRRQPSDPEALMLLGRILLAQEDADGAIERFESAVERAPTSSPAHRLLGEAYVTKAENSNMFKKLGLAKKAKAFYERAVELDPGDANARYSLIGYYLEAPGIAGGSVTKAREQAQQMIGIDALRGHEMMASVHEKQKEYAEAEAELRLCTTMAPDNPDPWHDLGLYLQRRERFADALAAFDKALEIDAGHANSLYQVGRTGALSGKELDRARQALLAYLEQETTSDSPSKAWAQYRLGMVYEHGGEKSLARSAFQSALKLDPKHEQAKKALKKLGS